MTSTEKLEKHLTQLLPADSIQSTADKDAVSFLRKANKLEKKGKPIEAANHYAALSILLKDNANIAILTARTYQKSGEMDDAARWFLITAKRYALNYQISKSVAALRIYSQIKPEDKVNPKRIYDLCLTHGADEDLTPSIVLDDKDIAGNKLLATDFFKTFDSQNINYLMENLTYHKLSDGEVISKSGDKAKSLYIIISGAVSGYLTLHNKRTYLGDVGENDICGETAYFTGGLRTAEMIAKGETELFELPYSLCDKFKVELPSFSARVEKLYRDRMLIKQLALTNLFSAVTPSCRDWVASKMKPVQVKAGELLLKHNDKSLDVYMVRTGKLAVTLEIAGEERLLKTIETGAIVGETAIVAMNQRTATVRAITNSILMKLDGKDYQSFYMKSKPLQDTLEIIKQRQIMTTFDIMKRIKLVEGDDACEILLQKIWAHR